MGPLPPCFYLRQSQQVNGWQYVGRKRSWGTYSSRTGYQSFWKNKGQIREIPRQNFEKNRGQCLGKKNNVPYTRYWVYHSMCEEISFWELNIPFTVSDCHCKHSPLWQCNILRPQCGSSRCRRRFRSDWILLVLLGKKRISVEGQLNSWLAKYLIAIVVLQYLIE